MPNHIVFIFFITYCHTGLVLGMPCIDHFSISYVECVAQIVNYKTTNKIHMAQNWSRYHFQKLQSSIVLSPLISAKVQIFIFFKKHFLFCFLAWSESCIKIPKQNNVIF